MYIHCQSGLGKQCIREASLYLYLVHQKSWIKDVSGYLFESKNHIMKEALSVTRQYLFVYYF
jgi:hypothetical protein